MEMTLLKKIDRARELIKEYTDKNQGKYSIAFSGGKDSTVLAHIARTVLNDHMRIDAILSDTEFEETHDFITEFSKRYQVKINRHFYLNDPTKPEEASKDNKVDKFKEVLSDVDCWFSGIRKDEGTTRTDFEEVEEVDGLVKVNPIVHFTEKDIWRYLAIHRVPVNEAYKEGYRSLSCKLTSVAEQDGSESERAGRWKGVKGQEGQECGIHSQSLRK